MKMKILQHSNSRNPFCQKCGKTGHQTGVCSTIGACFYCGRKHNALQCRSVRRNENRNFNMVANEYNKVNMYSNENLDMSNMMITTYDNSNMSQSQHRHGNWSESMPILNVNLSPYHPMRSLIAPSHDQYYLSSSNYETYNLITACLEETHFHLTQKRWYDSCFTRGVIMYSNRRFY